MTGKLKALALAAVGATVALVPLYGAPRTSAVSHAEWARMLLRALQMDQIIESTAQASQAFTVLSWKESLTYHGDRYLRAEGVERTGTHAVSAVHVEGDVAYPVAVVRAGDYRLRVRISGNPATPAAAEILAMGATVPTKEFAIVPSSISSWIDAGTTHLDRGVYTAALRLPPGTSLEQIEVAPPCIAAVEPPGGWRATAIVQATDLAVTTVKALDQESELPAADTAIEVFGADFRTPTTAAVVTRASTGSSADALWIKAGPSGLQAVAFVDLPEAGLYNVSTFGIEGGGQSWLGDACQKAILCGAADALGAGAKPQWRNLLTAEFTAGRHFFTVVMGQGAAVERLRLERKKTSPADYVATLKKLGFDAGPDGPVARQKAVDAMKFIQGGRVSVVSRPCGDIIVAANTPGAVQGSQFAQPTGPVAGPRVAPGNSGKAPGPLVPPSIPVQDPASPVTP
jgi:hypothetical protein